MSDHVHDKRAQRMPGQRWLVQFFNGVAADVAKPIPERARVLDFGCGDGGAVEAWRETGRDAFGCDIEIDRPDDRLRLIEEPYRFPFSDESFDVVVSNMVVEHVRDHGAAFAEIRRVLRPGGVSLHLFPARWTLIEPHVLVPLATVIQTYWWLALWARLGVRNEFQQHLPWDEVAAFNRGYLSERTNYRRRDETLQLARRWFDDARFLDALAMKHGNRTRVAYPLARAFPPAARLFGNLRTCLLLLARTSAGGVGVDARDTATARYEDLEAPLDRR
jgi:SAM-dependent methyltransferase